MIKRYLARNSLPLVDQALSSGTNFIAVFAVARALGIADFGVFALCYTTLTVFLGISRAFFGTPIALAAGQSEAALTTQYSRSMSGIVLLAIPLIAVVAVVGLLSTGEGTSELALVGVGVAALSTPVIIAQDISRYYAMAKNDPSTAVASDGLWLGGVVVLFAAGPWIGPFWVLFGWIAVAVVSLAIFVARYRFTPDFAGGLRLLVLKSGLRESLAVSVLLSTGVTLVMGFLMLPFLGASAVGALRGAGTLFGPLNTLMALLDFSILAQLSRADRGSDKKAVALITTVLCAVSAAWALVLLLLPQAVGVALLGETWFGTRQVLPITAIEYVLLCVTAGLALVLKLRARALSLLLNRVAASVTILVATVIALLVGGGLEWMALSLLAGAIVSAVGMLFSAGKILRLDEVRGAGLS